MKHILLSTIAILGLSSIVATAQTFSPGASALPGGTLGQAYSEVISFTVPTTVTVNTSIFDTSPFPNPNIDVSATVTDVIWAVVGLPSGLTATCDIGTCFYAAGLSGTITISGMPTSAGSATVDITSMTNGSADIPALGTFPFPQALPNLLDETGYTIFITDPNGIEESNEVFSLSMYPNPTDGISALHVTSTVAGVAGIEVYSITGALVLSTTDDIRVGANRVSLDLQSVPAGIYLVKADINGSAALVRIQKK